MVHPPAGQIARDFLIPNWPAGSRLGDVMLLVIGIVGTTVAPWQLFFQQSYVIDKRITPRFLKYEKADLWIGIGLVLIGGVAMMAFAAELFHGHPEAGNFSDAGGVLSGLARYAGRTPAVLFAVALIDASIIGAASVSLATAYAIGDVFEIRHSLHRGVGDAKGFYFVYCGIIACSAVLVLIPGSPLGLLTEAVQTLAGVLLPSATVFLLLLCNDKEVLGPWVNTRYLNVFTGAVIWLLVMLSVILTAATVFPDLSGTAMLAVLAGGTVLGLIGAGILAALRRRRPSSEPVQATIAYLQAERERRAGWRMPPLATLLPARLSLSSRIWMGVLRVYLVIAVGMVLYKVVSMMLGH
jgi:Mn2+/Fe2+ NRAMP family transporter